MLCAVACSSKSEFEIPALIVEGGQISGVAETEGVTLYKGIPYAAPPVGELRWKKPQAVIPWDGVRACATFGDASVQDGQTEGSFYWKEFYQDGPVPMSEDCLYLNVWTPAAGNTDAKLPVMVWIHGGAYMNGYGHEIEFDGNAMARKGVILVTINYRLGVCGFLAHPLLTAEDGQNSGNYGIYDQLAALRWVHNNIAQFGGDPDNVTVFGQSAGAGSVQALVSSPLSAGLVNKAIIQSGGGLGGILRSNRTLAEAEAQGEAMWDAFGVTTLEEMRSWPAERLSEVSSAYSAANSTPGLLFTPCVDGELLLKSPDETALAAEELNIPYMIGYVAQDLLPALMRKAAVDWSLLLEDQGRQPAYVYCFSHDLPGEDLPEGGMPGAFHSSELWYVFGTLDNCWRPVTDADYELSERMVSYWTNFAKTGNPNGEGLDEWEPCVEGDEYIHDLDVK